MDSSTRPISSIRPWARRRATGMGGSVSAREPRIEKPFGKFNATAAMRSPLAGFRMASTWSMTIENGVRIDETHAAMRRSALEPSIAASTSSIRRCSASTGSTRSSAQTR